MDLKEDIVVPETSDETYLARDLLALAQRHSPALSKEKLEAIDTRLRKTNMAPHVVLMFEFEYEDADAETRILLEFNTLESLSTIFSIHGADQIEDVMYMFTDAVSAVLVALQVRDLVEATARHTRKESQPTITIKGYGVHLGDVLFFPGTDVHWGDPINTASKLGQDLATDGDILISDVVYEAVRSDKRMSGVTFEALTYTKSKVLFTCYRVARRDLQTEPADWWVRFSRSFLPQCACTSATSAEAPTEEA